MCEVMIQKAGTESRNRGSADGPKSTLTPARPRQAPTPPGPTHAPHIPSPRTQSQTRTERAFFPWSIELSFTRLLAIRVECTAWRQRPGLLFGRGTKSEVRRNQENLETRRDVCSLLIPRHTSFTCAKPSFFIAWSKTEALVFHGPVVDADQEPSETREVQLQLRRPAACSQAKLPLQDRRSQVCMTWVGTFTVLHVVTSSDYLAL